MKRFIPVVVCSLALQYLVLLSAVAQMPLPSGGARTSSAKAFDSLPISPGVILLMELDGRFSQEVLKGGGKAFATWFAPDAVTLNNKHSAVMGKTHITATATWDPKTIDSRGFLPADRWDRPTIWASRGATMRVTRRTRTVSPS